VINRYNIDVVIDQPFYTVFSTKFTPMAIVWWNSSNGPRIFQTYLRRGQQTIDEEIKGIFPRVKSLASQEIIELRNQITAYFEGDLVVFNLENIALERCGLFQQQVLNAEYGIPRGWISTYGRIANHLGVKGGSRAVGGALAENTFPIIIPCHRAVRANGEIGGYQGGDKMKRALLMMEGIKFKSNGRVLMQNVYY
jgi:methylated-DNA-[protein]-cysteine S-methyltransferase